MAQNVHILKTNFSSGEITPHLRGRLDVTANQNGAEDIQNFIVQPQGSLSRRMGTKFICQTKKPGKYAYLIPFKFSNQDAFILEFGNGYIRFFKDAEPIMDGDTPYRIRTPYAYTDLHKLRWCNSADVLYLTHPDYYPRTLARYADNDWDLSKVVHQDGPYRATADTDKEITLWLKDISHTAKVISTDADFSLSDEDKFVQYINDDGIRVIGRIVNYIDDYTIRIQPKYNVVDSADLDNQAVLTYGSSPPRIKSTRAIWSSETEECYIKLNGTWRYMTEHQALPEAVGTAPDQYSADVMLVDDSKQPDMVSYSGDLAFENESIKATLKSSVALFSSKDVGRHFRMTLQNRNVWGWITEYTNSKTVTVKLGTPVPKDWKGQNPYIQNAKTKIWKLGAWYEGNYPAHVTIFQQRLIFANTKAEPNRLWFSESDDYVSFSSANKFTEVLDNSGFTAIVGSNEVNEIRWMQPGPVLLVGTAGEEYQIKASSISEPVTPTNVVITLQTSYGGRVNAVPIKIGPSTLFLQRHGNQLRELQYSFELDSFVAKDLTILAEHIIRDNGRARQMAYQQVPHTMLWVLCNNGKLLSFTYEKEHQVFAWARHKIGTGTVESIAVIPGGSGTRDDLYLIVRRTVKGKTRRYVEIMAPDFRPRSATSKSGMLYLDSSIEVLNDGGITRVSGLHHLEGKTVGILANHAVHPEQVVVNGKVDLQYEATHVYVGEPMQSYVKTLPIQEGSMVGSGLGLLGKIVKVDVQLLHSIGLRYGRDLNGDLVSMMPVNQEMGVSPPLKTDFFELRDDSGFTNDRQFYLVQDQPYPLTILSINTTLRVNE